MAKLFTRVQKDRVSYFTSCTAITNTFGDKQSLMSTKTV